MLALFLFWQGSASLDRNPCTNLIIRLFLTTAEPDQQRESTEYTDNSPFPFSFKGPCASENVQCVHGSALTLMASLFHRFLSEFHIGLGHATVKQDESPPEITSIHKSSLPALSTTSLQLLYFLSRWNSAWSKQKGHLNLKGMIISQCLCLLCPDLQIHSERWSLPSCSEVPGSNRTAC